VARLIDPDTAQEYIDDAVRETERAADVAIADLRAELEQTQHELRVAQHRAANHESLEDQWMAASRRILEMQSAVIDATTEREALRAEVEDLKHLLKQATAERDRYAKSLSLIIGGNGAK
jgi:chromosome segregation ATPase